LAADSGIDSPAASMVIALLLSLPDAPAVAGDGAAPCVGGLGAVCVIGSSRMLVLKCIVFRRTLDTAVMQDIS